MQTYGQKLVGVDFNPSGFSQVNAIKEKYAEIIDCLDLMRAGENDPEIKRLCAVAITEAEGACMRTVKAVVHYTKAREQQTDDLIDEARKV